MVNLEILLAKYALFQFVPRFVLIVPFFDFTYGTDLRFVFKDLSAFVPMFHVFLIREGGTGNSRVV